MVHFWLYMMRYSMLPGTPRVEGIGDWFGDLLGAAENVGTAYVQGGGGAGTTTGGPGTPAGGGTGAAAPPATTAEKKDNTWLWIGVAGLGLVLVFMVMKRR